MAWQPSTFTPDAPAAPPGQAAWSPSTFVPDSNVSGQQAAQAAGVKPVANDVPPLKVPPLPQNDPAGPSGEELSVTPELNPEVGYNANRGAPGTSMAAATKDQKAYADKLAAVTGAVGGKFDPSKGVEDAWDATRLSWMDQMNDRAKYLQDKGYDAKIINIPGQGPMTVFKTKDSDTWRPINGANWSAGDVGRAAAQIPGLATQIGTAAATEGASLPARMLMQALTGTGEKGIEEVGNLAAGSNSGTIGENATNAAKAGARSSLGELLGSILAYGSNTVKGVQKGVFSPTNEGADVIRAQERLNAANPDNAISVTPGAVGAPVVALREKQISPLSVTMQNAYDTIKNSLGNMVEGKANKLSGGSAPAIGDTSANMNGVAYPGLSDIKAGMEKEAAGPLQEAVPVTELSQGGRALRQGAETLKDAITQRTTTKYGAIPGEGTTFNVQPLQETAAEINAPVVSRGADAAVSMDANGLPVGGGKTTVALSPANAGYVTNIVNHIKGMFPQLEATESGTPFQQLQNIRSKLGNYAAEYPVGGSAEAIQSWRQARQMLGSLDNVLANPQGANAANFATKLKSAQKAATFQNQVLDNAMIQKIRNGQVPPEDLMEFASPNNYTNLQLLKRTMPAEDFAKYQDAWASSLVRNPDRIPAALKAFNSDPRALNILASPARRQLLTDYSAAMDKLNGSPIASMMAEKNFAARPAIALNSKDADGVADIIARAGGPDSPIGLNLRAAAFKSVVQNGQKLGKLDLNALAHSADNALNNPSIQKILPAEDLKMLEDVRTVAAAQGKTATGDMQGGLAAGHVAGGILAPIMAIISPKETGRTAGNILEAWIQAKMWSNPLGRRFMVGQGPGATISQRIAGAVGANAAAPQPNKEPGSMTPPAP